MATTTREVRFVQLNPNTKQADRSEVRPAGTEVYATPLNYGLFKIRIPGSLLQQTVNVNTIEVP